MPPEVIAKEKKASKDAYGSGEVEEGVVAMYEIQGEIICAPHPPPFLGGEKTFFRGEGGVYILKPPAQELCTPPPLTSPTPRRSAAVRVRFRVHGSASIFDKFLL